MEINSTGVSSALDQLDENIAWLDNMISNNEKRRHPRRKVGLKGDLALQKAVGEDIVDAESVRTPAGVLEMSASGAGILTTKQMNKGQRFKVVCPLKEGKLNLSLKVVRFSRMDKAFRYGCEMSQCKKIS